ncbi:MAG: PD-(D/E)XK nuclease domain-containing protein [Spirochaetota bacterium]
MELGETLRSHYNGYCFRADSEVTLYNSTSLNYYLKKMTLGNGRQPRELVDENLRMDIGWLERLAGSAGSAMEAVDRLVLEGSLPANVHQLASKFSMSRFLDPKFLPVALFYLGQLTYKNEFSLGFPNLTGKKIFIGYYNELNRLDNVDVFAPMFQRFTEDRDWAALFAGYWEHYIRRIPAQAFDKANENFYRSTFFELCSRYLQRYFVFNAELNLHSGRADLVGYGRSGEIFAKQLVLFEFKHLPREKAQAAGLASWPEARPEDGAQAKRYIVELLPDHPGRVPSLHVVHTSGNAEYRFF